jgi:hypothetical protein
MHPGREEAFCTPRDWRICRLILAAFRYADAASQDRIGLKDDCEVLSGLRRPVSMQLRGPSSGSMHDEVGHL